MTDDPSTVAPHDRVVDAARLMRDEDVGAIPTVEEVRLVGILAQADVARAADERRVGGVVGDISE